MKNKLLFSLIILILAIGVTTGCNKKEDNKKEIEENKMEEKSDVKIDKEYTELEILGAVAKFKKQEPTNYWDSEDNFGALEIDTVYIPSENGVEVSNYYEHENVAGIIFESSGDVINNKTSVINTYKKWYGIDIQIEDIEKGIYKRHIKGESSEIYLEAYCFTYERDLEGEKSVGYYKIELILYKDDYSAEQMDKLISEYQTIIDTLEIN